MESHFNYWDQKEKLRYQPPPSLTQVAPQTPNSDMSLEDIVKSLALQTSSYRSQMGQSRYQPQESYPTPNLEMSLEEIVKSLAVTTQQFQQKTEAGLQHLGNQMSQLARSVSQLTAQASRKLPSQTEANPRENVSAMTLRSEKVLHMIEQAPDGHQRR
ncbi:UNVERIFIED_CONTAM: hypothetical protein Sradi_3154500 [Sesamum radiatum]|uniref:Uncharacterized protein n=1 Tax=Sesamum radiatum TaxID=300843 RepID=A0AAW2RF00_SESRA